MPSDKTEQRNTPLISIIMPVYNCERYVSSAVDSIVSQTYTNWELLICDDGSTDATRKILELYHTDKRIKVLLNKSNIGKIPTVTNLYKMVKGDYVVFHDSDDISHCDRFKFQVATLQEDSSVGLVGCGYVMVNEKNRIINTIIPAQTHEEILEAIKVSSQFHFPTVMFNKYYLDQERNLFRDFFGDNNEDVDLAFRILTKSKGRNIGKVLYVYRILDNSISRKNVLRNAIYYYAIARDLALSRLKDRHDWLDGDPHQLESNLKRYFNLKDPESILIYANSVSYFLNYDMYRKAVRASFIAIRKVSLYKGLKLLLVTLGKISNALLFKKEGPLLNTEQFFIPDSHG